MGFDSAALAKRGFDVRCYEVSGPCLEFARRLFALNQLDVAIETQESRFSPQAFDAIVCLDVLEHLPDPPAAVVKFANWLAPLGVLVAHAPFYPVDATRPTHLRSNRRYSGVIEGLYGQAGFRPIKSAGPILNPLVLQKRSENSAQIGLGPRIQLRLAQMAVWLAKYWITLRLSYKVA